MMPIEQEFGFETVTVDRQGDVIRRATHTARQFVQDLQDSVMLEMVAVPEGMFLMGSRAGHGYDDERPQHSVRVPSCFMAKYPITQEQWKAVMGSLPPCRCQGARRPVDRVCWDDAVEFCVRLSEKTGRAYRLPSEAEWEYACRARTSTPFYCGETITTDVANYVGEHTYLSEPKGVYRHETTEVGSFPPNAFGLYDMHGNVWEWCADAWHDDYAGAPTDASAWEGGDTPHRVLRGGCWHDPPGLCRCAARLKQAPTEGEDYFGFRVALASPEPTAGGVAGESTPAGREITPDVRHEIIKWIVQSAFGLVGYGLILFLVAGRWDWLWGWALLGVVAAFLVAHVLILVPINPELLAEREKGIRDEGVKAWDKWVAMLAAGVLPIASWMVAGLGVRFRWTGPQPLACHIAGLVVNLLGYALFLWAMASNAFFSEGVRIQEERGHVVATGGPYRYVRHPGYVGAILAQLATPFLLGSPWALIPSVGSAALYVVRTYLEDRTLIEELPGYREYAQRTRYRLLPGVW